MLRASGGPIASAGEADFPRYWRNVSGREGLRYCVGGRMWRKKFSRKTFGSKPKKGEDRGHKVLTRFPLIVGFLIHLKDS